MEEVNRFNWRPIADSPRDGSKFVAMRVITHVGGLYRPISIDPELHWLHRKNASAESPGYLCIGNDKHGGSVGDFPGYWTSLEEYRQAIPHEDWRKAPEHNLLGGTGPLVFIRPTESEWAPFEGATPILDARVVWHNGPGHGWAGVRTHGYDRGIAPGFLDGHNGELPMRWCRLVDFFPGQVFDRMAETERNIFESQMRDIERWRRP